MPLLLSQRAGMQAFAHALAGRTQPGDCILLAGDVGAGKTTFAQDFIRHLLGADTEVTSPTFTLQHHYDVPKLGALVHMDLYRIEHEAELVELGLDDVFNTAICLIEWPERLGNDLPKEYLYLHIEIAKDEERLVTCRATSTWHARMKEIKDACIREAGSYVTAC